MQVALYPNEALSVQMRLSQNCVQGQSRFDGVADGLAWLSMPVCDGKMMLGSVGAAIKVTWQAPDGIYSFASRIAKCQLHPVPALGVVLPDCFSREQRRSFSRVDLLLVPKAVTLLAKGGLGHPLEAVIADLSGSGARLWLATDLPVGVQLRLNLELCPRQETVSLMSEVVRCCPRPGAEKRPFEAGISFLRPSPAEQRSIVRFVFSQQSESVKKGVVP